METQTCPDWKSIDLNSPCERALNLIEGLNFDTFLMEINCNLPEIDEKTVRAQFEEDLRRINRDAREVFEANLKNIVKHGVEYRKD